MEKRFALGTLLFIELGGKNMVLVLNEVGKGKHANLVTVAPEGNVPFQGGELPSVKEGTVGEEDIEHYIFSYLKKTSPRATPRLTIQQTYLLEKGIYTTEQPL